MAKPTIKPPVPPAVPVAPVTPRIAPLPAGANRAPDDAELIKRIKAINLPEAKVILAAYKALGNEFLFEDRLRATLAALTPEGDPRLRIHIARLSAEAYVFDIPLSYYTKSWLFLSFISELNDLHGHSESHAFMQFVMRRIVDMSSASLTARMQRVQLDKAIELFNFIQRELDRDWRGLQIGSESTLVEYRQLLFKILQKHYQLLLDHLFAKARGTAYKRAVTQLEAMFEAMAATARQYETPPTVAAFRISRKRFRDYFHPNKKSDFPFQFFSKSAPPVSGDGPELVFQDVLANRHRQLVLLRDLRPGVHDPGTYAFPDPPRLHDNTSWQEWARRMWDSGLRGKTAAEALTATCHYVTRYFNVLSAHVPFDLEEGSGTKNYLARTFPRAITGSVVHDCLVYAIRWIFILGRLFSASTMPSSLRDPKVWLIEMPAHVGVMLRVRLPQGLRKVDEDALIVINNQHGKVITIVPGTTEEEAAEHVAGGMYAGLSTPAVIHEITAKITDAKALWRQISKLADRKLLLPYPAPDEPALRYLRFNAESAKIARQLKQKLSLLFYPMVERLEAVKPEKRVAAYQAELELYRKAIDPEFRAADKAFLDDVKWIEEEISEELDANMHLVPKAAVLLYGGSLTDWETDLKRYNDAIDLAKRNLDLWPLDPEALLPDSGFPEAVQ